ncbi:MAG: hypothetical protein V3R77_00595 [Candidatus Binatia bacterium]
MQTAITGHTKMTVINCRDWGANHTALLEVPSDASVAEVVEEARVELELPADVSYLALLRDRQLDGLSTLQDAGVETDDEIDLVANVRAG